MQRALKAFAIAPSQTTFLAAFQALSRSSGCLAVIDVALLAELAEAGDHAAFAAVLAELPPIVALSPAVHALAAQSARTAGDAEDAELEEFLLEACLAGILDSGDGSPDSPYFVVCTADERHICQALGLEPGPQALINRSGTALDVVQCLDGTDVWFDLSRQVPLPAPHPIVQKNAKCAARPRERLSQSRR
ncbi:MAG TPA: hypothetical protein VMP01_26260 [Pirellulaceae bacterium]|nr:hypothetical protein [Pirellulaceae bacterium]